MFLFSEAFSLDKLERKKKAHGEPFGRAPDLGEVAALLVGLEVELCYEFFGGDHGKRYPCLKICRL
jgi:hypothetical protein